MISSSWFLFHEEVVKIKHHLEKGSYSISFIDKKFKFFLENKMNDKILPIMLLSTLNYLILAILQNMSSVSLISFLNFIARMQILGLH